MNEEPKIEQPPKPEKLKPPKQKPKGKRFEDFLPPHKREQYLNKKKNKTSKIKFC